MFDPSLDGFRGHLVRLRPGRPITNRRTAVRVAALVPIPNSSYNRHQPCLLPPSIFLPFLLILLVLLFLFLLPSLEQAIVLLQLAWISVERTSFEQAGLGIGWGGDDVV